MGAAAAADRALSGVPLAGLSGLRTRSMLGEVADAGLRRRGGHWATANRHLEAGGSPCYAEHGTLHAALRHLRGPRAPGPGSSVRAAAADRPQPSPRAPPGASGPVMTSQKRFVKARPAAARPAPGRVPAAALGRARSAARPGTSPGPAMPSAGRPAGSPRPACGRGPSPGPARSGPGFPKRRCWVHASPPAVAQAALAGARSRLAGSDCPHAQGDQPRLTRPLPAAEGAGQRHGRRPSSCPSPLTTSAATCHTSSAGCARARAPPHPWPHAQALPAWAARQGPSRRDAEPPSACRTLSWPPRQTLRSAGPPRSCPGATRTAPSSPSRRVLQDAPGPLGPTQPRCWAPPCTAGPIPSTACPQLRTTPGLARRAGACSQRRSASRWGTT